MMKAFCSLAILALIMTSMALSAKQGSGQAPDVKVKTHYDSARDRTTVKLLPILIASEQDKYHSLHMSPSFNYPGRQLTVPETVDFELQTVVKGRLRIDLYVVFIIDGERIFLSSNRSGIKARFQAVSGWANALSSECPMRHL
jgi:hypothetical protein